jgi:hypothetical protein
MGKRLLLLAVQVLCIQALAWAAQIEAKATIDERCMRGNATFSVPAGQRAEGFKVINLSPGVTCTTGDIIFKKGWGISNGNACTTGDIYIQDVNEQGKMTETLPLYRLVLGPGTYCIHVNGGRGAHVLLSFELVNGPVPAGPNFGALDKGGMPECLLELAPNQESVGWVVYSRTPYVVWSARKRTGEPYTAADWRSYGPLTLNDRRHYIVSFNGGGNLMENERATGAELSPALASLGFRNQTADSLWLLVNPLPPGCVDENVHGIGPAAKKASLSPGKWKISQPPYSGTLVLAVDGKRVSGRINWANHPSGTLSGTLSADFITFTVSYPGGQRGTYTGKIATNGKRITNGTTRSNDNATARWSAELISASTASSSHRFADGELIRQSGTDPVYLVEKGLRRWIPNPKTFEARGFSWGAIKDISAEEMRSVPEGPPIPSVE